MYVGDIVWTCKNNIIFRNVKVDIWEISIIAQRKNGHGLHIKIVVQIFCISIGASPLLCVSNICVS